LRSDFLSIDEINPYEGGNAVLTEEKKLETKRMKLPRFTKYKNIIAYRKIVPSGTEANRTHRKGE